MALPWDLSSSSSSSSLALQLLMDLGLPQQLSRTVFIRCRSSPIPIYQLLNTLLHSIDPPKTWPIRSSPPIRICQYLLSSCRVHLFHQKPYNGEFYESHIEIRDTIAGSLMALVSQQTSGASSKDTTEHKETQKHPVHLYGHTHSHSQTYIHTSSFALNLVAFRCSECIFFCLPNHHLVNLSATQHVKVL